MLLWALRRRGWSVSRPNQRSTWLNLDIPNALSRISAGLGGVREIGPLVSGIEYTTQAGAE